MVTMLILVVVLCFNDNWSEIMNFGVQFLQCGHVGMMCVGMRYVDHNGSHLTDLVHTIFCFISIAWPVEMPWKKIWDTGGKCYSILLMA